MELLSTEDELSPDAPDDSDGKVDGVIILLDRSCRIRELLRRVIFLFGFSILSRQRVMIRSSRPTYDMYS
jgi:hypothetical protein